MRSLKGEMKFIVDGMLGRLAKWLRILGYDTAYFPHLDDDQLVRLARAEGRLLLTRDRGLARRRGLQCLLIESDYLEEQLDQILAELALTEEHSFSRCPVCNTPLQKVEKTGLEGRVPPHIFRTHKDFSLCPNCDKIYWPGTHWARMQEKLAGFRQRT
ncbi:MAG TPA: hypothetical protein EYP49_18805 [Anaerolineae bacterium]|nr:hypothetical protein [Anaerolineae bacterium]